MFVCCPPFLYSRERGKPYSCKTRSDCQQYAYSLASAHIQPSFHTPPSHFILRLMTMHCCTGLNWRLNWTIRARLVLVSVSISAAFFFFFLFFSWLWLWMNLSCLDLLSSLLLCWGYFLWAWEFRVPNWAVIFFFFFSSFYILQSSYFVCFFFFL